MTYDPARHGYPVGCTCYQAWVTTVPPPPCPVHVVVALRHSDGRLVRDPGDYWRWTPVWTTNTTAVDFKEYR